MIMKVDILRQNKEINIYISNKIEYEEVFDLIDGLEDAFSDYTINLVGETPPTYYIDCAPQYKWNTITSTELL